MSDLRTLLYLDMAQLKNGFLSVVKNPSKLAIYIFQGLAFLWIILMPFLNSGQISTDVPGNGLLYLSAAVTACVLLTLLALLYFGGRGFRLNLGLADIALLLPSPVGSRAVYFWMMVRSAAVNVLYGLLISVYIPYMTSILGLHTNYSLAGYMYLGVYSLVLLWQPFQFMVKSLDMRFHIANAVRILALIAIGGSVGLVVSRLQGDYSISGLLGMLSQDIWLNIPVIGWIKDLIMAPYAGFLPRYIYDVAMLCAMDALVVAIGIYFAVDYYEEAAISTAKSIRNKKRKKEAQKTGEVFDLKPVLRKRRVNINSEYNGEWAFLWQQRVLSERTQGNIIFNYNNLTYLIIGVLSAYFMRGQEMYLYYMVIGIFIYALLLFGAANPVSRELKKIYFYLIPGDMRKKLLVLSLLPMEKVLMAAVLVFLPVSLSLNTGAIGLIAGVMIASGFEALNLSIDALFISIFKESLYTLLRFVIILVILGMAAIVAVPIGILAGSVYAGIIAGSAVLYAASLLMLRYSGRRFERAEI